MPLLICFNVYKTRHLLICDTTMPTSIIHKTLKLEVTTCTCIKVLDNLSEKQGRLASDNCNHIT